MSSKRHSDEGEGVTRLLLVLLAGAAALGLLAPAAALASGDAHGFRLTVEGFYILDFIALVAIIIWVARKPLRRFLLSRKDTLEREIDEARELQTEARSTLEEYSRRMKHLDDELAAIRKRAREDGEASRARIVEDGEAQAQKLLDDADARVRQEEKALRRKLVSDFIDEALGRAREMVSKKLTPSVQRELVGEYVDQIEQIEGLAGSRAPQPS